MAPKVIPDWKMDYWIAKASGFTQLDFRPMNMHDINRCQVWLNDPDCPDFIKICAGSKATTDEEIHPELLGHVKDLAWEFLDAVDAGEIVRQSIS